ncbi:MAG: hypothetical protein EOP88_21370 [Verrucomicrobiaceae bacterium]|nr:MAG: hypothetical protein EOP88_21370 [Verrucomicrobiaceae bacterium]
MSTPESPRENETPDAPDAQPSLAEQFRASLSQPPSVHPEVPETSSVRSPAVPPPLPARVNETSVLRPPAQVHVAMGPAASGRPAVAVPPPAPAPAPSARRRSGRGIRKAEAACWSLLALCLTGSLLGNALLSLGWREDVAAKEREALSISTKREETRATRLAKSRELEALRPGMTLTTDRLLTTSSALRNQGRLEVEIKTNIVEMEQQLMDAELMPRAPLPKEWPNKELDDLIDSNPLIIP